MSKIRLYELAKELGLENKAVLDLCVELGISGKKSHSNTLTDDEADRIRRSVIRQAVSGSSEKVRDVEIGGSIATERRVGNVIRRRKKTDEELEQAAAEESAKLDLSSVPHRSYDFDSLTPDFSAEKSGREAALARADALFKRPEEVAQDAETEAEAPLDPEETEQLTELAAPESEIGAEAAVVEAQEPGAVALEESGEGEASVDGRGDEARLEEARRRLDVRAPKVLGKIELPQKPVAPKREERTDAATAPVEEGARGGRPGKKKTSVAKGDLEDFEEPKRHKPRKQVLSKGELLDYGSERDWWRGKKEKRKKDGRGAASENAIAAARPSKRVVKISSEISVGELAKAMGAKVGEVMTPLMKLGVMATINQTIDFETATLIAGEFGFTTVNTGHDEDEFLSNVKGTDDPESLEFRPPVVTVMGHVDHGKTSLLDVIRKSSVTAGEAGGITQHIGAYNVKLPSGESVTFLDTPGHAAFTAMRSRGAKVTDIVVLVVAADDGVMPQTVEAINHAKAANVPIIVAVNKIDKEDANIDRIKTQLAEHELVPEEWGGTTIVVPVSAHTKQGVDLLLENLALQSEIMELKANPNRAAIGNVVESALDRGKGPVITVLVTNGTLRKGDAFLAGAVTGRVRALVSDQGTPIESAGPGMPVEVLGASAPPLAGDEFLVLTSESEAREVAEIRARKQRLKDLAQRGIVKTGKPISLESFSEMMRAGEMKDLPIIVKADVQGSVEAVTEALSQIRNEEAQVKIIHAAVGAVTETDVQLAQASSGVIVAFNVRAEARARELAESSGVDIRFFRIIYELLDSIRSAVDGMLSPKFREKTLGRVEVRQTFRVPKLGVVAGSYVLDGTVERGANLRLLRDNRVVFEGKMASLRRFKEDVREVASGYECGIGIEGYSDIKDGDIIEVYKMEEVRPTTSGSSGGERAVQ